MLERLSFEELHDDERLPLVFPNVINGADVGVVECRSSPSLTLEALQGLFVSGEFLRQELQGNLAAEPGVFGLVHDTHATATQLLQDAVVRDDLADHGWK